MRDMTPHDEEWMLKRSREAFSAIVHALFLAKQTGSDKIELDCYRAIDQLKRLERTIQKNGAIP